MDSCGLEGCRRYGTVLVDEGHHVFSHEPNAELAGQHRLEPHQVRDVLRQRLSDSCRTFSFHDTSYQNHHKTHQASVSWKMKVRQEPHQAQTQFLKRVIRMPTSVRDVSVSQCKDLEDGKGLTYFKLHDEKVMGANVRYYDIAPLITWRAALTKCLDELMNPDQFGLTAGQIAVLLPLYSESCVADALAHVKNSLEEEWQTDDAQMRQIDEARKALMLTQPGVVAEGKLYLGPVHNFVGLERPAVVVLCHSGEFPFEYPSQGLLYSALKRCTYQPCIVAKRPRETFGHYQIGKASGKVIHSWRADRSAKLGQQGEADGVGRLEMEAAQHASPEIRKAAVVAELDRINPSELEVKDLDTMLQCLDDEDQGVRQGVVAVLRKFEPSVLSSHAEAVVQLLKHTDADVRLSALEILRNLDTRLLATNGEGIEGCIQHKDAHVRMLALQVLGEMEPSALAQYKESERDCTGSTGRCRMASASNGHGSAEKTRAISTRAICGTDQATTGRYTSFCS